MPKRLILTHTRLPLRSDLMGVYSKVEWQLRVHEAGLALLTILFTCTLVTAEPLSSFESAARSRGTPDIPGLNMVWLVPWGSLQYARDWRYIVVHNAEAPAGSAWRNAVAQMQTPNRRGAMIWVETDGTVYWACAEFAVPSHTRGGNRADNRFIDNTTTHQQIDSASAIGVEFVGNYPNVRRSVTNAQLAAWRMLLRVLQTRYNIPNEHVFAHNWIDYKDSRYCEGCALAQIARGQGAESALHIGAAR